MSNSEATKLSAARIAIGYAVVATLWIAFSDLVLTHLKLNPFLQTFKGIVFVAVTALLLYFTIRRLIDAVRRTSRERDETAKLYRTVVDASEEGICLVDKSGRITFLNRRLATMLGDSEEKLLGRHIQDFVHEPESLLQRTDVTNSQQAREFQLLVNSDQKVWVLISTTTLFDSEGKFCGSLAMFLDVTERRRLETELRQSQKLEALGSFAGGIAHDFNNLLSIMTGYGTLLENALPPESEENKEAREILTACQRGSLLIRQLLAFSRKQAIVPEVVNVHDLVSSLGEVLPRMVGEHISIAVQSDETAGWVRIGAGQIEQILMNLASNARDAMPNGGSLTITTSIAEVKSSLARAQGVEPGAYVTLRVTDTGVGIDPEVKARIFEPFFTTKPQGAGTGLGLSTVFGIVTQNRGFLACDSTVGVGTTFNVYLPRAQRNAKVVEFPAAAPRTVSGSETVLLVEDEPALRVLTKHILSSHGYVVLDAPNGIEALRLVEDGHTTIDLLLTDIVMPGMSGIELAHKLSPLLPATDVVFMSGYSDVPHQLEKNVQIIQKPIAPGDLLLQLRMILDARRLGGTARMR